VSPETLDERNTGCILRCHLRFPTNEKLSWKCIEWLYNRIVSTCKDCLVSASKPYVHPIVGGKENNGVEFGAKTNSVQIDRINFITYISFDAFNEGTRGIPSIQYARLLMRKKVTHFAADVIYATNKTRKHCSHVQVPYTPHLSLRALRVKMNKKGAYCTDCYPKNVQSARKVALE
jgi:hypothetical protein